MNEAASLVVNVDTSSADKASLSLDMMAAAGSRAEKSANKLATAERGVEKATGAAANAAMDAVRASQILAGEQEAVIMTANRLNAAHGSAIGSSKAMTQATLNMSRQFADVGVTAAMGMNPLMILIQQGPQIADAFQMAASQGLGFKTVLAGLGTQLGLVKVSGGALASAQFAQAEAAVADAVAKQAAATAGATLAASNLALAASAAAGADGQAALAVATARDTVAKEAATAATAQLTAANAALATSAGAVGTATKVAFGPVLAVLLPIAAAAAAVGSVFAVSARQINEENKDLIKGLGLTAEQLEKVKNKTVTMGDVATGTFNAIKGGLAAAFGDELKAAGKAMDSFFEDLAAGAMNAVKAIVGGFLGAYGAVTATWKMLPGAFGDAVISAAQAALDGLAKLVNGAIGLLNPVIAGINSAFGLSIPQLDLVQFGKLRNDYAGQMAATAKAGAEAFDKGNAAGAALVNRAAAAIANETLKATKKRILEEAGKAKAKADRDAQSEAEKALKASQEYVRSLTEEVATMGMSTEQLKRREIATKAAIAPTEELARAIRIQGGNWEYQNTVMKAFEAQTKSVASAVNDNIKTMAETIGDVGIPNAIENMATEFDKLLDKTYSVANSVDDIFYSIKNNDWGGAFSGLLNAVGKIKAAFDTAGKSKAQIFSDRVGAVAGVGMAVGSAIGGRTGSAISGVASGAAAGAAFGPWGAAIGGALGGISSLFGSSKAKKQAKAEAEAQRVADAAAKALETANQKRSLELQLMELQGKSAAALAEARKDELAGMDASNRALAEQVYAAQDAAGTLELGIQLLEARGMAEEALYQRQQQQLRGLAEADQAVQRAIWAEQDLAKVRDAAASRATEIADRTGSIQDQIDQMTLTSAELMAKARATETAEAQKLDAALVPLLERLYGLQDASSAAALAAEDMARAQLAASNAANAAAALLQDQRNDAAALVSTARSNLVSAYTREADALQATIDKQIAYTASIQEYRKTLFATAGGGAESYASTAGNFDRVAALARLGNAEAQGQFIDTAEKFRQAALNNAKSSADYARQLARIDAAAAEVEGTAGRQATIAEQQLEALRSQVDGLVTLNESVLSVGEAIKALQSATRVEDSTWGGPLSNPGRSFGLNPEANKLLARTTGYAGDFGSGGFQAWIEGQPEATKAQARAILQAQGQSYRIAFASGGAFTNGVVTRPTAFNAAVMGEAGPEAILPLTNVGGQLGVRSTGAGNAELIAEIRALRQEVASLRIDGSRTAAATEKTAKTLVNVTRDGDAMLTEAA